MSDTSLGFMAIMRTRLADDCGSSITGGDDTFGSALACVIRSLTTWRARSESVPGSKCMTIEDTPGMELDSMDVNQGTPLSRSDSSGTVSSCSTSEADRPSASVWTSTSVGENSGSTSTDMSRKTPTATANTTAAAINTSNLNLMLARISHSVMTRVPYLSDRP